jgi:hypothetical protein
MNLAESYYYDFKTSDLIFKSYQENFNFILNKIKSYQENFNFILNKIKSYQDVKDVKEIQVKEDILKIYELRIKQFSLDFDNIIKTINYYNLSLIIYEAPVLSLSLSLSLSLAIYKKEKSINQEAQEAPEIVYDSIGNISSHIFKDFKLLLDKINKENLQYLDFYELFLNLKEIKNELMSINIDRGYVSKES